MNARMLAVSALALVASGSLAQAAIVNVTGQTTWLGSPPVACGPGALTGFNAHTWDEQTNVSLSMIADMVNNPGTSGTAIAGGISGSYDSHFVHFEPLPGAIGALGTVTFSQPIAAVLFRPLSLDNTDASCGAFGTVYPTTYPFRGLNAASMFSINANVLTFNFQAMAPTTDVVQVRVLTAVPAPGALGLAGLGGLCMLRRRR